jgi:hypothetical protein
MSSPDRLVEVVVGPKQTLGGPVKVEGGVPIEEVPLKAFSYPGAGASLGVELPQRVYTVEAVRKMAGLSAAKIGESIEAGELGEPLELDVSVMRDGKNLTLFTDERKVSDFLRTEAEIRSKDLIPLKAVRNTLRTVSLEKFAEVVREKEYGLTHRGMVYVRKDKVELLRDAVLEPETENVDEAAVREGIKRAMKMAALMRSASLVGIPQQTGIDLPTALHETFDLLLKKRKSAEAVKLAAFVEDAPSGAEKKTLMQKMPKILELCVRVKNVLKDPDFDKATPRQFSIRFDILLGKAQDGLGPRQEDSG